MSAVADARRLGERVIETPMRWLMRHPRWLARLPSEPGPKVPEPWGKYAAEPPEKLRSVPGIWRDREAEIAAFNERPLYRFFSLHPEAEGWILQRAWHYLVPAGGRMMRAVIRANSMAAQPEPTQARTESTVQQLASDIRAEARRLGLSAVGFADYDPKYTFAQWAGSHDQGTVIVCIVEQDYAATQTAPSIRSEKAAVHGYADVVDRACELAAHVRSLGYRAAPHDFVGQTVVLNYGVEAGLGQLGLNGQLLTPQAGSRARICVITTDLPIPGDGPVDYGINQVCDACQVCVRRCPTGAIPLRRAEHRGVTKSKIKLERCLPVVAQAEGCAVCMKVCPVQKFGLEAVLSHYESMGEILGKGTDELEGYRWPLDGLNYPAQMKPRIDTAALLHPPGLVLDPTRVTPHEGGPKLQLG